MYCTEHYCSAVHCYIMYWNALYCSAQLPSCHWHIIYLVVTFPQHNNCVQVLRETSVSHIVKQSQKKYPQFNAFLDLNCGWHSYPRHYPTPRHFSDLTIASPSCCSASWGLSGTLDTATGSISPEKMHTFTGSASDWQIPICVTHITKHCLYLFFRYSNNTIGITWNLLISYLYEGTLHSQIRTT